MGQPEVWSREREDLNRLHTGPHFKRKNNSFSVSERKGSMVLTSHIFTFLAKIWKILLSIYFPKYVQEKQGITAKLGENFTTFY